MSRLFSEDVDSENYTHSLSMNEQTKQLHKGTSISSWRDLLRDILNRPCERQRLFNTVNVQPITLQRWLQKSSKPRLANLLQVADALPEYREHFHELLRAEKGLLRNESGKNRQEPQLEIPATFYQRVLALRAEKQEHLRYWAMSSLLLRQIVEQMDGGQRSMAAWFSKCMPLSGADQKVHSLRMCQAHSTIPEYNFLEHRSLFLGIEAAEGQAVSTFHPVMYLQQGEVGCPRSLSPVVPHVSAAIYPILDLGRVAGALTIISLRPQDFSLPLRAHLFENYAALYSLALQSEDFYPPSEIALGGLPTYAVQQRYLIDFRHRVQRLMIISNQQGQPLSISDAEDRIWQELESELLRLALEEER